MQSLDYRQFLNKIVTKIESITHDPICDEAKEEILDGIHCQRTETTLYIVADKLGCASTYDTFVRKDNEVDPDNDGAYFYGVPKTFIVDFEKQDVFECDGIPGFKYTIR